MPKLYIMKGLPASGKTRYCREHLNHCVRVNRDALRWMVYNKAWNPKREDEVTNVEHGCVIESLAANKDVVIDSTNLNSHTLKQWYIIAKAGEIEVEVVDLTDVPPWTCSENDRKRPQHEQVGPDVIWSKYYKYLAPKPYKGLPDAPSVLVCDLDGTVRDNSWRDAYDTTGKCIDDPPRWNVINAVRGVQGIDYPNQVYFFSGMEGTEINYSATETWLNRYFTNYSLWMRPSIDKRRDSYLKKDMFDEHVCSKGLNVSAVFDDRPQVIRECWVPLGLWDRIFSVGRPYEEF